MPFNEHEFLGHFDLGEYRDAIGAFIKDLQAIGYLMEHHANGASIRKAVWGGKSKVTVGWISHPGVKMRPGARDVTLGTWKCPKEAVAKSIAASLEDHWEAHASRLASWETLAKNAGGVVLPPQLFIERRQEVTELMRNLADVIDRVGERQPPG